MRKNTVLVLVCGMVLGAVLTMARVTFQRPADAPLPTTPPTLRQVPQAPAEVPGEPRFAPDTGQAPDATPPAEQATLFERIPGPRFPADFAEK